MPKYRAPAGVKPPKARSPNHPIYNLQDAIVKVHQQYEKYGRHPITFDLFCGVYNYNPASSGAIQLLAALRAYGLVSVVGQGDARKIAVTESGERIVRKAPDRAALVRAAALAPAVHREVWEHYKPTGGLPHDDIIRRYLLWERDEGARFTEDAVDKFIERLRQTLDYAEVVPEDKITDGGDAEQPGGDDGFKEDSGDPPPARRTPKKERRMPTTNEREFVFDLEDDAQAVLTCPRTMSEEDIEDFEDWLKVVVRRIKRNVSSADSVDDDSDDAE